MGSSLARQRAQNSNALGLNLDQLMDVMTGDAADGLVLAEDGSIQLGHYTLTPRGLMVSEGASFEEWQQVGLVLRQLQGSIQWMIGDWVAHGETVWGKTIPQIAEAFGYKVKSVVNFAYVARHVEMSIRMDKPLEFGHHALVAPLPLKLQREWLEYALRQGLSVNDMRKALRGGASKTPLIDAKAAKVVKRVLNWDAGAISDEKARARMLKDIAAARATLDAVEKKVRGE